MLTQEQIQTIQMLYRNGNMKKDIAEQIGCSLATVGKYTKNIAVESDDMVGKVFGRLEVIRRAPKSNAKNRCRRYICKCICGNETEVNGGALRSGHTTSCGCKQRDNGMENAIDMVGQKFGKLLVLERDGSHNGHALWKCKCDCGQIKTVEGHLLRSGSIKSCGCVKSWKEIEISRLLDEIGVTYIREYSFEDLVSDSKRKLRFDFAVMQKEKVLFLIEYQGEQHYNQENIWYESKMEYHDKKKKDYCEKNNIPLYILDKNDDLVKTIEDLRDIYGL